MEREERRKGVGNKEDWKRRKGRGKKEKEEAEGEEAEGRGGSNCSCSGSGRIRVRCQEKGLLPKTSSNAPLTVTGLTGAGGGILRFLPRDRNSLKDTTPQESGGA